MAGWALGQAGLKSKTRKGLAALILGANMPDIDVFFGNFPWTPLAIHRGFTHGLVGGIIVMPPILYALLLLLDRWQVGRGTVFRSGLALHRGWLLGLCYLGALTHPLLDLLTTYSVQLLSPFSNLWFHADGLFIIDLFLWILLGGAIFWSKRREKKGGDWRRPVQAALGIALAYISINLLITQRATAAVHGWAGERRVEALFASPPPFYFWQRGLVWREGDCYRWSRFHPFAGGLGPVSHCVPRGLGDPRVRQGVAQNPGLRKFLRWSVMPLASSELGRCELRITIADARYMESGARSRLMREAVVPTGAAGCPPVLDSAPASP